jgi:hypothetical protein
VEQQIVEFPLREGGILVFRQRTVFAHLGDQIRVRQEAQERLRRIFRQTVDPGAELGVGPRLRQLRD